MALKTFLLTIGYIAITTILLSCRSNTSADKSMDRRTEMRDSVNLSNFDCISNHSGSHRLCRENKEGGKKAHAGSTDLVSILIIEDSSDIQIFYEQIKGGNAKWIDDRNVEIYYPAGIPGKDEIYVYNIDEGVKKEAISR